MKQFFRTLCVGFAAMLVALTSFAEGRDVTTEYLRNVDMEQGVKYWAIEGDQPLERTSKKVEMVVGFHGMYQGVTEAWKNNRYYIDEFTYRFAPIGNSVMMQRIPNLPNGTYVFGAYAGASHQNARNWQKNELWSNRDSIYGVSLFANGSKVPVATDNPDWGAIVKWAHSSKFNVATTVTNGTLKVGLKVEDTNANYVVWDNVTLYYFGDMSEAEALDAMAQIDMERAAVVAQELTTAKMNVDTLEYLNEAIAAAMEGNTTAATLWDDNEEIYYRIGLARKSIRAYALLMEEIEAARVVAAGEWSSSSQGRVELLNKMISEAEERYAAAQMNDDELAFMHKALSWSAGDVRCDSLYIAVDTLKTFIDEARSLEGEPGGYTSVQIQNLEALRDEVLDTMFVYENDIEQDMAERIVNPNDLLPYIESIYAAIENVKNNAISTEYTKMPIEFKRADTPIGGYYYIDGAELNAEGLISYSSPMYRFQDKVETFRITVNSAANNQSYFCLSELAVYDGSGNRIRLTEDNVTSNADHNALNHSQDGGGIPALFDEDTNTYFHSTWLAGSSDGGAHYLEITLPDDGYDAFSFQMIARGANDYGANQNFTFPGEMEISCSSPMRDDLVLLINHAKSLNAYSFSEVGYYIEDFSYLMNTLAQAEVMIEKIVSEDEYGTMLDKLRDAVSAFEANENKAIRLPEAGKAYRIVSAFPGFFEKQGVEKTVTINEELQTLWWEDVQTGKSLQEFVFEPVLDEDGAPYIEIESIGDWDGTIHEEVYYCYYVKNVATGLYMGDVVDNSFVLSEEATNMVRLKWLGRGQWNIEVRDYNEEFDSYTVGIMHAGDHNGGNPSTTPGEYGGSLGVSSSLVSWNGGIDSPSAWFIREYQSLPYDLVVAAGEYQSDLIRFESSDVFTLTADKSCAFAGLKLYDMFGDEIAIDHLTISDNTATIRQDSRLVACAFAFTNSEGVATVTFDAAVYVDHNVRLQVAYDAAMAVSPQVGVDVMQYADITAYTEAMTKAAAMLETNASAEAIDAMIVELEAAVAGLVPNMPIPGRLYYIVSAMDAFAERNGVSMMMYENEMGAPYWTYENLYKLNRCWLFEPAEGEEGYYLKNAGTGMYLGRGEGFSQPIQMVGDKYETTPYVISSLGDGAAAIASNIDDRYKLHAINHSNGAGRMGAIAYWNDGAGTASAWRICDAEAYGLQVPDDGDEEEPVMGAISTLADADPAKCYTISTNGRGAWAVDTEGTYFSTTTVEGYEVDATDARQQFAILTVNNEDYYLYSVSAQKFVKRDRTLTAGRADAIEFVDASSLDAGRVLVRFRDIDDANINIGGDKQMIIDRWSTIDEGNAVLISEAAEFNAEEALAMLADPDAAELANLVRHAQALAVANSENHAHTPALGQYGTEAYAALVAAISDGDKTKESIQEAIAAFEASKCLPVFAIDGIAPGMSLYESELDGLRWQAFDRDDHTMLWVFDMTETSVGVTDRVVVRNLGTGNRFKDAFFIKVAETEEADTEDGRFLIHPEGVGFPLCAEGNGLVNPVRNWSANSPSAWKFTYMGTTYAINEQPTDPDTPGDGGEVEPSAIYYMAPLFVEGRASSVVKIPIKMENSGPIVGFQFDMFLPEGVSVVTTTEDGETLYNIALNKDRAKSSHTVAAEPQEDGALKIISLSMENVPFEGNDGVILEVEVAIGDLEEGNYDVILRNIRMTHDNGVEEKCPDYASRIYVKGVLMGDVDGDGTHTISDVVMTINAVLKRPQAKFDASAADMNGDGMITVGDAVSVLRLVLGGETAQAPSRSVTREIVAAPVLEAGEPASIGGGRMALPVALNNSEAYSAFQLDVVLPEGVELAEATLTGRAKGSHHVAWNTLADGTVRIVAYAMNNAAFEGNDGTLFNLVLENSEAQTSRDEILLADVLFVTTQGVERRANDVNVPMYAETTGVDEVYTMPIRVCGTEGAVVVACATQSAISIYAITGQLVQHSIVEVGEHVIALPAGVYVVNGSKVIVK